MNFRKTLTTPQARRCSTAVVATAAAALLLTPATAFAGDRPAGAERPTSVGLADSASGGRSGGAHSASGHGEHSGHGGHSSGRSGHSSHKGDSHKGDKKSGKRSGRKAGKLGKKAEHGKVRPAGQHHPVHHGVAGVDGGAGTDSKPGPGSTGTDPKAPNSTGKKAPSQPGGPKSEPKKKSEPKQSPESGPMATVTKLSMSKNLTSTRPLNFAARVSPAHRTVGAPRETGTVDFTIDGSSSGPIAVANNRASVKVKLSPGKHTASAKYSGDSSHSPSNSGPVNFAVS